jgi:methionyl-tRNA synthetase
VNAPTEYNQHTPMSYRQNLVRRVKHVSVTLPLLLCFALLALAQLQSVPPAQTQPNPAETEMEQQQKHAAEKASNTKRQQDIKKDTDKLLQLATELKQYVDKSNENTLSLDVIKKSEEIEKLAHTIREKMKGQ